MLVARKTEREKEKNVKLRAWDEVATSWFPELSSSLELSLHSDLNTRTRQAETCHTNMPKCGRKFSPMQCTTYVVAGINIFERLEL